MPRYYYNFLREVHYHADQRPNYGVKEETGNSPHALLYFLRTRYPEPTNLAPENILDFLRYVHQLKFLVKDGKPLNVQPSGKTNLTIVNQLFEQYPAEMIMAAIIGVNATGDRQWEIKHEEIWEGGNFRYPFGMSEVRHFLLENQAPTHKNGYSFIITTSPFKLVQAAFTTIQQNRRKDGGSECPVPIGADLAALKRMLKANPAQLVLAALLLADKRIRFRQFSLVEIERDYLPLIEVGNPLLDLIEIQLPKKAKQRTLYTK